MVFDSSRVVAIVLAEYYFSMVAHGLRVVVVDVFYYTERYK